MYVGVLEVYLECEGVCIMYLKYCPVGDRFGFQVGFLKQYFLWVCLYICFVER